MENSATVTTGVAAPPRRRPYFLLGVGMVLLGPVVYAYRINQKHFDVPWYVPILATVGVLLMGASVWRRRGVLRAVGLVLFVLLCGFEWFVLLVGSKTPVFTGPAQPGQSFPVFASALADGQPFTDKDLASGTPSLLVFFRGRW